METILKCKVGSQLYGTNTENSDTDYASIYHKDAKFLLGLEKQEQITTSTGDNNKANSADDVDVNCYSLHEFCRLAMKNNPNILELFFIPDDKIIYASEDYQLLKDMKDLFISKRIFKSFFGYATAQRKLMLAKTERLNSLKKMKEYLEDISKIRNKLITEDVSKLSKLHYTNNKFMEKQEVEQLLTMVNKNIDGYGSRRENIENYGFETKFASHLIRLMIEGIQLAEYGIMEFPMKEAPTLLSIKRGELSIGEVLKLYDILHVKFKKLEQSSKLRTNPDFQRINNFVIENTRKRIIVDSSHGAITDINTWTH
jgi:uncharacterized protein